MATHIIHPEQPLKLSELDRYLERGWRPTGQSIYTSDYLRTDDDELHGCLQLRLPLKDYAFKARHRKLLRRNARRFRVSAAPAELPDAELLEVNRRYMAEHADKTREDLEYNVISEAGHRPLNTWVFRVYDGEKLVAFSYFDRGERVMYSKSGIYDPAYARYSLGSYTMLLEIEAAIDFGFHYYYPGYYSPTYPAFDYKLRLGPMEYRTVETGEWLNLPTDAGVRPADPLATNRERLRQLENALTKADFTVRFKEYPSFTGRFRPTRQGESVMLDAPQLLLIGQSLPLNFFWVATFDNESQLYRYDLVRTANLYDMRVQAFSEKGTPRFTTPVVIHKRVCATDKVSDIVRVVRLRNDEALAR